MEDNHVPDEEIQAALKACIDVFDQEDRSVRDRQIRMWRRLKLYWDGFQRVWYSEVAHDWRVYDEVQADTDNHNGYYDKPVNVFRALLESIIAALSITIPPVKCTPDDADNPLDLATATTGTDIAELVYKHNNVSLLWLHALFVFMTEGLIACYNRTVTDEKFGTFQEDETEDVEEMHFVCPECEAFIDDTFQADEFDPGTETHCPECESIIDSLMQAQEVTVTRIVGQKNSAKSRQKLEVYGGLYVKVPNYAISQEQCPYLFFSHELHYSQIIEEFEHLHSAKNIEDWTSNVGYDSGGMYDPYERWGRLNPTYHGEYPVGTVTKRECWLRPSAFNVLESERAEELKELYPDGVKVILANDMFAAAVPEALDDHWTLTKNPLSDYLHHDPVGLQLTSIQDITNEIVSLTLQTMEHGIPQTFADPRVLDFDEYRQTEVAPGTIFPALPASGKSIGDAFYEIKTSSLSSEVLPFWAKTQEQGQFVSGALPSLYGGNVGGTASEYSMSRAQALQRLQTQWKMLAVWWKQIFGKVIPAYMKDVQHDDKFVRTDAAGNFVTVFLRKADMEGKIGEVELETGEQLPIAWSQVKDTIVQLMEMQNPVIMSALTSPENLPSLTEAIGLSGFKLPGEADRTKQFAEIQQLLQNTPMVDPTGVDPVTGQPIEVELPSIPIELDVDDHAVQAEICRGWAVSLAGQQAKVDNPEGYKNVLLHFQMHQQALMQQMAPPEPGVEGGDQPAPPTPQLEGVTNADRLPS